MQSRSIRRSPVPERLDRHCADRTARDRAVRLPPALPARSCFEIDQLSATGFVKVGAGVAADTGSVHTPIMTLKNAALLALIGTILMAALSGWTFVFNFLNLLRGLVPALVLFSSFIYAFACFSVAVFFYVFHRAQS